MPVLRHLNHRRPMIHHPSQYASIDKSSLVSIEGLSATFSFTSKPSNGFKIECVKYVSLFLNDSVKIEPLTVAMSTYLNNYQSISYDNDLALQALYYSEGHWNIVMAISVFFPYFLLEN
ncbi:hypothetical protein V6N11_024306 [Hibiscus sabdariffa]|uniref:Uncharacterized protein n=1 Tax=Hibiscus sabdariffa TaxID=183260 RepID=A0ABR2N7T1_9ROSI